VAFALILAVWSLSTKKPATIYPGQMFISIDAARKSAELEGNADAKARLVFYAGSPTNGWSCNFPEQTPFTATLENTPRGLACRVITASGQTLLNITGAPNLGNVVVNQGDLVFRADRPPASQPDGDCSVIIGWWTPKSGVSIPIGVVLTKMKIDSSNEIAPSTSLFGPVIEQVLQGDEAVDLDSNQLVKSLPTELNEKKFPVETGGIIQNVVAAFACMRQEGLDIFYSRQDGFFVADMKLKELNPDDWNELGAAQLMEAIRPSATNTSSPTHLNPGANGQAIYGFQTREGGIGLLQLTGFTDNPRGVKILYKLVQNGKN
jgi:hypothetical protein